MRAHRHILMLFALGLVLGASGCGMTPQLLARGPAAQVRAKADPQAAAVVAEVRRAWTDTRTMSGVVALWEQQGSEISRSKAEFFWSRPEKLRANVTEADSAMKRGAKLVYLGDKKVTVKVAFIKKTLPYDDPQLLSLRGYRIDQTSITAVVGGLLDPQATLRHAGSATFNGRPADLLEGSGSAYMLPGLTKMVVAVDKQTHMPSNVEGYAGNDVVFRAAIPTLAVNPQLPDHIFTL